MCAVIDDRSFQASATPSNRVQPQYALRSTVRVPLAQDRLPVKREYLRASLIELTSPRYLAQQTLLKRDCAAPRRR
jgi:hypothetical protein